MHTKNQVKGVHIQLLLIIFFDKDFFSAVNTINFPSLTPTSKWLKSLVK